MNVGLKKAIEKAGNQEQLAFMLGVHPPRITYWKQNGLTLKWMYKIHKTMKIKISDFFVYEGFSDDDIHSL